MLDKIIIEFDKALKSLTTKPKSTRIHPDENVQEKSILSQQEKQLSISLMRVNHSGEVCAQALYQGQSLITRNVDLKNRFLVAAMEENDHLAWTNKRIEDLGGRTSIFNPILYVSSFTLGLASGLLGDQWSLGFLKETETQVEKHLENHQHKIPIPDKESFLILEQMKLDEREHANMAKENGAIELPIFIKKSMSLMSKIMIKTTYYI